MSGPYLNCFLAEQDVLLGFPRGSQGFLGVFRKVAELGETLENELSNQLRPCGSPSLCYPVEKLYYVIPDFHCYRDGLLKESSPQFPANAIVAGCLKEFSPTMLLEFLGNFSFSLTSTNKTVGACLANLLLENEPLSGPERARPADCFFAVLT